MTVPLLAHTRHLLKSIFWVFWFGQYAWTQFTDIDVHFALNFDILDWVEENLISNIVMVVVSASANKDDIGLQVES